MNSDRAPGMKSIGMDKSGLWNQLVPENDNYQPQPRMQAVPSNDVLDLHDRDRWYREFLESKKLSDRDRADLSRRGLSDDEIDEIPVASSELGYAVVFRGLAGTFVGSQWRIADPGDGARYKWQNLPGGKQFPGTNEMPIAVYPCDRARGIALVEGVGVKPYLAAKRLEMIAIGAAGGQHASSPTQLRQILLKYRNLPVVIVPDAGDIQNPQVMQRHERTAAMLQDWGVKVKFLWWNQLTKDHDDVDEASEEELDAARSVSFKALANLQNDHAFTETLDQVDLLRDAIADPLQRDWVLQNYAAENGLKSKGFNGTTLAHLAQARKDAATDLEIVDAHDILKQEQNPKFIVAGHLLEGTVTVVGATGGTGKAQPLDAKILTPSGWKMMGDVRTGDLVIGQNGKSIRVVGVFPQGEKEVFEVEFSDGSKTECCADHLWHTKTKNDRGYHRKGSVKDLREIVRTLKTHSRGDRNHSVPMVLPVEFDSQYTPLDPYFLGCMLGDGGFSDGKARISKGSQEFIRNIVNTMPFDVQLNYVDGVTWRFAKRTEKKDPTRKNSVVIGLESLGLMGLHSYEKFVPDSYKFNSVETRISILQGLLDSDGCLDTEHSISFTSTSETLALDVQFLVQSLGGKAVITSRVTSYTYKGEKKTGRRSYRVTISLPSEIEPFRRSETLERYKPRSKYPPARLIVGVKSVGIKTCQCIKVDSDDELYVTDDFIVTHNTTLLYDMAKAIALGSPWSFYPTRQGRCLIVQTDEPRPNIKQKLTIAKFQDVPRGSVEFLTRFRFTQFEKLAERIRREKYTFVVIDSWTAAHAGTGVDLTKSTAGENAYLLRDLAEETGCAIVIVHHLNKMGDLRDSSTLFDNVSEVWKLSKGMPEDRIQPNQRILSVEKSRSDLQGKFILEQNAANYSWIHLGEATAPDVNGQEPLISRILYTMTHNPGSKHSASSIAKSHQTDYHKAETDLERLRRQGTIEAVWILHGDGGFWSYTYSGKASSDVVEEVSIVDDAIDLPLDVQEEATTLAVQLCEYYGSPRFRETLIKISTIQDRDLKRLAIQFFEESATPQAIADMKAIGNELRSARTPLPVTVADTQKAANVSPVDEYQGFKVGDRVEITIENFDKKMQKQIRKEDGFVDGRTGTVIRFKPDPFAGKELMTVVVMDDSKKEEAYVSEYLKGANL